MVTPNRVRLHTLLLLTFVVHPSQPVCVDVQAEKEAVVGQSKKLTCIACMKREEVKATTRVEWHYQAKEDSQAHLIFKYDGNEVNLNNSYTGRLTWNGSQDLQDLSIAIVNVTFNDSGFYECKVFREFEFKFFNPSIIIIKNFTLSVREKGGTHEVIQVPDPYVFFFEQWSVYKRMPKIDCTHSSDDVTAIYSEIMMYVLLVFLTFWLLVEMVYCYRKISKSDEQAQDTATDYLAIPSEQKDNPATAVTE